MCFLDAALRKHGLDPKKDLKLINNIGPAARHGALDGARGQADYAIFLEPEAGHAGKKTARAMCWRPSAPKSEPVDYTVFTATDAYLQKIPAWPRPGPMPSRGC